MGRAKISARRCREHTTTPFAAIDADPDEALLVLDLQGTIAGTFQFTVLQVLSHAGSRMAQVENVVVDEKLRGYGLGSVMMRWAIDEGKRRGCRRLQLTSNRERKNAHRFYERLGFAASHADMQLDLRDG